MDVLGFNPEKSLHCVEASVILGKWAVPLPNSTLQSVLQLREITEILSHDN
jgi:hypothetical protein